MLFWIETEQSDVAEIVDDYIDSFESLGVAGWSKYHLILGSRQLLTALASSTSLSIRATAYYKYVHSRYAELASIKQHIDCVYVYPRGGFAAAAGEDRRALLRAFEHPKTCDKANLLVEHVYDYRVILEFARAYLSNIGLARVGELSLRFIAGGGGGTGHVLSVYESDGDSIGCCVVDSDRERIDAPVPKGSTADFCAQNHVPSWRWVLHIVDGRELENLIPDALLEGANMRVRTIPGFASDDTWAVSGFADHKKDDLLCRFLDGGRPLCPELRAALDRLATRGASVTRCCHSKECAQRDLCKLTVGNKGLLSVVSERLEKRGCPRGISMVEALRKLS